MLTKTISLRDFTVINLNSPVSGHRAILLIIGVEEWISYFRSAGLPFYTCTNVISYARFLHSLRSVEMTFLYSVLLLLFLNRGIILLLGIPLCCFLLGGVGWLR
jgi:hypothetical protein